MGALSCAPNEIALDDDLGIACYNGPKQTVISGSGDAVDRAIDLAKKRGIQATRVPVAAAFHSPMMAPAAAPLRDYTSQLAPRPNVRGVFSTVTGDWLRPDASIPDLLASQLTLPVRFREALEAVAREADLLIEVGPGHVLTNLASFASVPVVSSDRILDAVAAAWNAGADVDLDALFENRFARPFELEVKPTFIISPTETFAYTQTPVPAQESTNSRRPTRRARHRLTPRAGGEARRSLTRSRASNIQAVIRSPSFFDHSRKTSRRRRARDGRPATRRSDVVRERDDRRSNRRTRSTARHRSAGRGTETPRGSRQLAARLHDRKRAGEDRLEEERLRVQLARPRRLSERSPSARQRHDRRPSERRPRRRDRAPAPMPRHRRAPRRRAIRTVRRRLRAHALHREARRLRAHRQPAGLRRRRHHRRGRSARRLLRSLLRRQHPQRTPHRRREGGGQTILSVQRRCTCSSPAAAKASASSPRCTSHKRAARS